MLIPAPDSPEVLPMVWDPDADRVCLVRLGEGDYRRASFLDERLLLEPLERDWIGWSDFAALPTPPDRPCDFIFHQGHVGSTLLSRVLDERQGILGLREPAVLRPLATAASRPGRLPRVLAYLSRAFRPEQRALIKATSFVSEIGPEMMALRPTSRAILMFVAPQVFLTSIFAGPNSRAEARTNAAARWERLSRRLGEAPGEWASLSEGETIAVGWLAEAMALGAIGRRFPDRVLWLDFDSLLQRPLYWIAASLHHLEGRVDEAQARQLALSPAFQRYSKGQEHAYDAGLRAHLLAEAARDHAGEIDRGLQWLDTAATRFPAVAESLRLIAGARRR